MRKRRAVAAIAAIVLAAFWRAPDTYSVALARQNDRGPATWRTWHLESPDQFRLDAPPNANSRTTRKEIAELLELQDQRSKRIRRRIGEWNKGPAAVPWTEMILQMIVDHRPRPPFAARALALLHTGLYDAMVAAADSKAFYKNETRPKPAALDPRIDPVVGGKKGSSYVPVQAAMAGAAERILAYLFPSQSPATFEKLATQSVESRLYAGANYRSDVERARELGHKVAGLVIARGQSDGSTNTGFATPRPDGEQYWEPTGPVFQDPIGGPVGTWQPWLMDGPGQLRSTIAGPFAYGSAEFLAELEEVVDVEANLTQQQREIAFFWDDGPRTYTPAGHWFDIAVDLVDTYGYNTNQATRAFALLGATTADAAIAFFEAKYFWWSIRPITAIWRICDSDRHLCTDDELDANGDHVQDGTRSPYYGTWYSLIETPSFPSYPGGHSTFSGSAGKVLTYLFPDAAGTLNTFAEEAASSRLYGGIHFDSDNDDGLILGRAVADLAIQWAEEDGSGL